MDKIILFPLTSVEVLIRNDGVKWSNIILENNVSDTERRILMDNFFCIINNEIPIKEGIHFIKDDLYYSLQKKKKDLYLLKYERRFKSVISNL